MRNRIAIFRHHVDGKPDRVEIRLNGELISRDYGTYLSSTDDEWHFEAELNGDILSIYDEWHWPEDEEPNE